MKKKEWSNQYIDYTKLKAELESMISNLDKSQFSSFDNTIKSSNNEKELFNASLNGSMNFNNLSLVSDEILFETKSMLHLITTKELLPFLESIESEIKKFFVFYLQQEKNLFITLNSFLHKNSVDQLAIEVIDSQIKEIFDIIMVACQISSYTVLNMRALAALIRIFNKKFYNKIPKEIYIFIHNHLLSSNQDLFYIFQMKTIDESSIILINSTDILTKRLQNISQMNDISNNAKFTINKIKNISKEIDNNYFHLREHFFDWLKYLKMNPILLSISNQPKAEIKKENKQNHRILVSNTDKFLDDNINFDQSENWMNESQLNEINSVERLLNTQMNETNIYIFLFYSFYYMLCYSSIYITIPIAIIKYLKQDFHYYGYVLGITSLGSFSSSFILQKLFSKRKYRKPIITSMIFLLISNCMYILSVIFGNLIIMFISRFILGIGSNYNFTKNYFKQYIPNNKQKHFNNFYLSTSMIGLAIGFLINILIEMINLNADHSNLIFNSCNASSYINLVIGFLFCGLLMHSFEEPFSSLQLNLKQSILSSNLKSSPLVIEEEQIVDIVNQRLNELNCKGDFSNVNLVQTTIQSILSKKTNNSCLLLGCLYIYFFGSLTFKLSIETVFILFSYYIIEGISPNSFFNQSFASVLCGGSIFVALIITLLLNYYIKSKNSKTLIVFLVLDILLCFALFSIYFISLDNKLRLIMLLGGSSLMLIMMYSFDMIYTNVVIKLIPSNYCICRIEWIIISHHFAVLIQILPGVVIGLKIINAIFLIEKILIGMILTLLITTLILLIVFYDYVREQSIIRIMKYYIE